MPMCCQPLRAKPETTRTNSVERTPVAPKSSPAFRALLKGLEVEHEQEVTRMRSEISRLRQELQWARGAPGVNKGGAQEPATPTQSRMEAFLPPSRFPSVDSPQNAETGAEVMKDLRSCVLELAGRLDIQQRLREASSGEARAPSSAQGQFAVAATPSFRGDAPQSRTRGSSTNLGQPGSLPGSRSQTIEEKKDPEAEQKLMMATNSRSKSMASAVQDQTPADLLPPPPRCSALYHFLDGENCEVFLGGLILANTLVMAMEMQYDGLEVGWVIGYPDRSISATESWPGAGKVFPVLEAVFTFVFAFELLLKIAVLGWKYVKHPGNWMDGVVVGIGIVDLMKLSAFESLNPMVIRLLRLVKLARGLESVKANKIMDHLSLLIKCLYASITTLFWSLCLLLVIQCISAMIIGQMVRGYLVDESFPLGPRHEVYKYYGTFSRSMLTMFEVTMANWSPPCRVLVDNISEWYSAYFLFYRCIVGFAVVGVINAVFIQQTMTTAARDQDVMLQRKEKEQEDYSRKLKELFRRMDTSGDGFLSYDEFQQMLQQSQMKVWMSSLEIDPSDVTGLFQLLLHDNEYGELSFDEFLDGAGRLKGQARSMDLAKVLAHARRIEDKINKMETLFRL